MSAAVCGSKRSLFEELPPSPPLSKRLRCSSSTSPIRFPPPSLIDHLRPLFPHMDHLLLERALQECGNDLDAAIKRLNELCLGTADGNSRTAEESEVKVNVHIGNVEDDGNASASGNQPALMNNLPADGTEWVDFFVREMMVATSVDDARGRAARMLEVLEKSISSRACADATDVLQKENLMLKEQIEVLIKEKNSFKNAFRIQHERFSDYEDKNQELQHLKQSVSQYQDQIRTLELNNYTLAMHLKQAQQNSNPFSGRFPPDVF